MASTRTLTILLFVVAIVAALATGAAVTLWLTRQGPEPIAQVVPQPAAQNVAPGVVPAPADAPAPITAGQQAGASAATGAQSPAPASSGVFINEKEATPEQLNELARTYGAKPPAGRYWYDTRSGLYGVWGHEAAGYIRPGHNFGQLSERASSGDTGVFINGRHINMTEALFFQQIFGAVYQGRWWLDGHTGNVGQEGNPTPIANVVVALQQASSRGGRGAGGDGYRWRDNISNSSGGAVGGCVWVNMPGSSYSSSGCE